MNTSVYFTIVTYITVLFAGISSGSAAAQQIYSGEQIDRLKSESAEIVERHHKLTQVMIDKLFSFAELGFQEYESSRYITTILEENGFDVTYEVSGMPTAWFARWGSGEPVIALGSDLDGIPKASQKPGVAYHSPLIEGAPGHGEGHNSGVPVNIAAALAVKEIMEREGIPGTLVLWPGIAEEQLGGKAYYVRDGLFEDVDICIFTHVSNNLSVSWGDAPGTGLISVEYTFEGEAAHSGVNPWRGRSALDAVQLMNTGWNYRREHLHPLTRSHAVITEGGDQPNVVPSRASVWYYFRDVTYQGIMDLYEIANRMAEGAALMTDTKKTSRILGSAWPRHFNKTIAETMYENIQSVGLPEWSDDDQALAKAVQAEVNSNRRDGLATELSPIGEPPPSPVSGGSDDIGDISWNVPTVTLRYPSNIPGLPGHHWSNAIAMATPIAHKGATAGAKVAAMTILDFLLKPELIDEAWEYFNDVQTREIQYEPMISEDDRPALHLNSRIMEDFRPQLKEFYFDETRYDTYLEQLGIRYPTIDPS
jgi:aminobenzoyl-glutamate utilization protein B